MSLENPAKAVDRATALVHSGQYHKAYKIARRVAEDHSAPHSVRADAFYLLGVLTEILPQFGCGDECGLSYYKRALELRPDHLWAMYGVVATFGERFPSHQDVEAVRRALDGLMPRIAELPPDAVTTVMEKVALLRRKGSAGSGS